MQFEEDKMLQLFEDVASIKSDVGYIKKTMDSLENRVNKIEQISDDGDAKMGKRIGELEARVINLENQPAKKAQQIVDSILKFVGIGLLGFICATLTRRLGIQ